MGSAVRKGLTSEVAFKQKEKDEGEPCAYWVGGILDRGSRTCGASGVGLMFPRISKETRGGKRRVAGNVLQEGMRGPGHAGT